MEFSEEEYDDDTCEMCGDPCDSLMQAFDGTQVCESCLEELE